MSKDGVFPGPFGLKTGKCAPEITPYLDTFHAVLMAVTQTSVINKWFLKIF